MDLKQLDYMIKIAEEKNITRAAEKLFITQSALNQQLLRLEKELGAQLFVRTRANWQLTPSGKIYIENAKEIVRIKKDTYNKINDIINVKSGRLRIGLTPERGQEMFASIYPVFYKRYPQIKIEHHELSVRQQQQEISNGNLDLGFLTLQDEQKTGDEHITICHEDIVLAVPKTHHLSSFGGEAGEALPEIELDCFREDTFAVMQKGSTLRDVYDQLTEDLDLPILLETKSCRNLFHMVAEGICCTIIPATYAKKHQNVVCFSIQPKPVWEICVSYKKGSYLSTPAKELISYAKFYWNKKCNMV